MTESAATIVLAATTPTTTTPSSASGGVVKKKFAAPPVKSACLACRAARTRCDGVKPCATCQSRSRECIYTPSRRGGPRCRKKSKKLQDPAAEGEEAEHARQIPDDVFAMLSQEPLNAPQHPMSIQDYIGPGAGLKHLEDWVQDSDFIFDSLFINSTAPASASTCGTNNAAPSPVPVVRAYRSDAALLDAYYVHIHPYLPILPPPLTVPLDRPVARMQHQLDTPFATSPAYEPTSPLALALAAVLALLPCPEDTAHATHDARVFRRKCAQYLAQSAWETIESDEEIPDSSVSPPRALSEEHRHHQHGASGRRPPFCARVPPELESVVALAVLSVYEYAQRGNLRKTQGRAGMALMGAMEAGLHKCVVEDEFTEARRRIWWMTYICVAQAAIVSNTKPTFSIFSTSYTAAYPTFLADPEAFTVYIQAQRAILAATQFVIELNQAVKENADMNAICDKMKELELFLEPQLSHSESWLLNATTTSPVDPTEEVVTRSLRCMASIKLNSARIKVHRYCAFFDIPVFSRKHCDLQSLNKPDDGELRQWPTCSCSTLANNPFAASSSVIGTPSANASTAGATATNSTGLSPSSDGSAYMAAAPRLSLSGSSSSSTAAPPFLANRLPPTRFPFSSHQSAKICLKSALAIAHAFDELPFPNPTGSGPFMSPTSAIICPRTMPSFACCAMQCAYALLMVHQKTKTLCPEGDVEGGVSSLLLARLQAGLTSIYGTLANYSVAFEALGGMRDQIRSAVEESAAFVI